MMPVHHLYYIAIYVIFCVAAIVFITLFYVSAPYGKFSRHGWGPVIKSKWAWMIMESPSPTLILIFFLTSGSINLPLIIFAIAWLAHYFHRTLIYPFRQSGKEKSFPLVIGLMAFIFNCINGFINGYGVFRLNIFDKSWIYSWQFVTGIIIFMTGFVINKTADEKLKLLGNENPGKYQIPRGWLFRYISCPHYFGEVVEWGGWALMTWSLAGLAFFVFTIANLFPRAIASHKWYKSYFQDYPSDRKAVIPFVI